MNLLTPPENADALLAGQMKGSKFANEIEDTTDKTRFVKLSNKLSEILLNSTDEIRREMIPTEEVNSICFQMYTIARKHGIKNDRLLR